MAVQTSAVMSSEQILGHAGRHTFTLDAIDFRTPIDRTRYFICPSLTPLYYTDVYRQISTDDTLRYNQLSALCFSEMISFFESTFVRALHVLAARQRLPPSLAACVERFISEETKHQEMWRRLNLLSEPAWYSRRERAVVQISWPLRSILAWLAGRPERFPVVVWMMLLLEEHSMEISRRCNRMPADAIEPRYRAAYRLHMEEEVRHVHTDQNLLQHLMHGLTAHQRRTTRWLFGQAINAFFLRPKRAAVRVVDVLVANRPALRPLRNTMAHQLGRLHTSPAYTAMMFSPETTPAAWVLWNEQRDDHVSEAEGHR